MRKHRKRTAQRGELPGAYVKRSLVTIPAGLEAAMIVSEGAKRDLHYVVTTRRQDNLFRVEVEFQGQTYVLPHRVVAQVTRHMVTIQAQQRRDGAVQRAQMLVKRSGTESVPTQ